MIDDNPEKFNLRPRDVAYAKVGSVYESVKDRILGFQPDYDADSEELLFDDEVWRGRNEITGHNEVYLESIDAIVAIRGLFKIMTEKNGEGHKLFAVTFLTDGSDMFPDTDPWPIEARPDDERPVGFGEVVFGQEMPPVLVNNDSSGYAIWNGVLLSEKWMSAEKIEITDRDAEVIVAKLTELQDCVSGYDPSTFPDDSII